MGYGMESIMGKSSDLKWRSKLGSKYAITTLPWGYDRESYTMWWKSLHMEPVPY